MREINYGKKILDKEYHKKLTNNHENYKPRKIHEIPDTKRVLNNQNYSNKVNFK